MIINVTPTGVVESTIMYGIVHAIWSGVKIVFKLGVKEVRAERNRIIHNHVKAGHEGRLKHCIDEACLSLRRPALVQQQPEQPGPHTDL